MADEHESAVAAWLDHPATQREVKILATRFPRWQEADRYLLAIFVEILTGMDFYGEPLIATDEEDDEEKWKRGYHDPDATGSP